jgi:primosomal protein N' (replication factor Y)
MDAAPGVRVQVPYRGRSVTGIVISVRDRLPLQESRSLQAVRQVLDASPVIPAGLLEVILRAADRILSPPGLALAAAIPPGTAPRPGVRVSLKDAGRQALKTGQAKGTLGKLLWSLGNGPVSETILKRRFPSAVPGLARLEQIGWIARVAATDAPRVRVKTQRVYSAAPDLDLDHWNEKLKRAPKQRALLAELKSKREPVRLAASESLRALIEAGAVVAGEVEVLRTPDSSRVERSAEIPIPTPHQAAAIERIGDAIQARRDTGFLLYGITGSGKTVTHQLVDRFRTRFGDRVAVLHSGLSAGERFDQWRRIRDGAHPIAIGARSAIFAPFEDLGLIVIDEEHDAAYKSEEGFRFHARDVALLRAEAQNCPVVLGGATPDVGTAFRADRGEFERLRLPERVASRPLPSVEVVDMSKERRRQGRPALLSGALRTSLRETLQAKQQAILFVNRRGFASWVYCFSCGHAIHCKHCDIALVYHSTGGPLRTDRPEQGELRCHYCGYSEEPNERCPSCLSSEGGLLGFGTERVEEEVRVLFPDARVARLDRDTSKRKGAQREILRAFHAGETEILVGTQMVAKGHDVPGVTLVGVIAADLGLHFPDFRASERTFQLLTQVAGRAGRGDDAGRVIVQTFLPDHYAIELARTHDYDTFYREELERRRPHGYPPFRSLWLFGLSGLDPKAVEAAASDLAQRASAVPGAESVEVLGPAPAPLARIRDRYRWHVMLLGAPNSLRRASQALFELTRGRYKGVDLRVVPSPVQML